MFKRKIAQPEAASGKAAILMGKALKNSRSAMGTITRKRTDDVGYMGPKRIEARKC